MDVMELLSMTFSSTSKSLRDKLDVYIETLLMLGLFQPEFDTAGLKPDINQPGQLS
jgi:hypothetical protein